MFKYKIGDKVRVKNIPSLPEVEGEVIEQRVLSGEWKLNEETEWLKWVEPRNYYSIYFDTSNIYYVFEEALEPAAKRQALNVSLKQAYNLYLTVAGEASDALDEFEWLDGDIQDFTLLVPIINKEGQSDTWELEE